MPVTWRWCRRLFFFFQINKSHSATCRPWHSRLKSGALKTGHGTKLNLIYNDIYIYIYIYELLFIFFLSVTNWFFLWFPEFLLSVTGFHRPAASVYLQTGSSGFINPFTSSHASGVHTWQTGTGSASPWRWLGFLQWGSRWATAGSGRQWLGHISGSG